MQDLEIASLYGKISIQQEEKFLTYYPLNIFSTFFTFPPISRDFLNKQHSEMY